MAYDSKCRLREPGQTKEISSQGRKASVDEV